jgi:uncharacterized metal-binding protein
MSENNTCCLTETKTLILGYSGGSNVGQAANNVMIELDKSGVGNAYCLAGIGASLSGFIESAKTARTIVIDGCPVGCAKKAFEKHEITPSQYFVVTEIGIEKKHNFSQLQTETKLTLDHILSNI